MSTSRRNPSGPVAPTDPQKSTLDCPPARAEFASNGKAALHWSNFGFDVIPILPGTQQSAVNLKPWLEDRSPDKLANHWSRHPDHEVGAIVGNGILVLDAESPESNVSLLAIIRKFEVWPNMIIRTAKGAQYFFRRVNGTVVTVNSHSTEKNPERIGVKIGQSVVKLLPSAGSTLELDQAKNTSEFTEAPQKFVDAVSMPKGMLPPRPTVSDAAEPQIEPCGTETVDREEPLADKDDCVRNPLNKYSLRDKLLEIERLAITAVALLGQLVLMGQFTFFFAAANTGKTLLIFFFLVEAIQQRRVDPSKVYYIDMDDNSDGLLEKLRIAVELGFHIVAEGYRDFSVKRFIGEITAMIENDQAHGVIVILDTYKKFANVMDKGQGSKFNHVIRRFVMKGGTVIALAHTNKNPGPDGKPKYGGTTDSLDDCDCAYVMRSIEPQAGSSEKVVEFDNLKNRGTVVKHAAYKYSTEHGISYSELLSSVQPVDDLQLAPIKQAEAIKSDAEVIGAVEDCIREGTNSKVKLRDAVAERVGVSQRTAIQVIERYTGDDPAIHRWKYSVRERGAKVFAFLANAPPVQDLEKPKL